MQQSMALWKTKLASRAGSPERVNGEGASAYMSPERRNSILNEALDDSAAKDSADTVSLSPSRRTSFFTHAK